MKCRQCKRAGHPKGLFVIPVPILSDDDGRPLKRHTPHYTKEQMHRECLKYTDADTVYVCQYCGADLLTKSRRAQLREMGAMV